MSAYYNEFDPFAAAWLRELMAAGLIPAGDVDERSIADVRPEDVRVSDESRHRIEQRIGKLLGYPPLYPEASNVDDGTVCVGDHVAETLVEELCQKYEHLKASAT